MAKKKITYDAAMAELQQIVEQLQGEHQGIDDLTAKAKRAAELLKLCKRQLRTTELEIEALFDDED